MHDIRGIFMETQQNQQPLDLVTKYLNMVIRRKWIVIFTAIPILSAGIIYCLITPKVYKTYTAIVVVPQRVPESYVVPTVTGDTSQRIRTIMQQVTSRTNLEKVIREFDLYREARKQMPMEKVVEMMLKQIDVSIPNKRVIDSFTLSYEGKNPVLIAEVLNYLANIFIEENIKQREKQAMNTANFLNAELDKIYQKLVARENALKQYKIEHMGELPEQLPSNNAMLERLQSEYETLQESIRRAEDRKLMLSSQRMSRVPEAGVQEAGHAPVPTTLSGLKSRLETLQSRYTDKHPDVVEVKKRIAELEIANKQGGSDEQSQQVASSGNSALDSEIAFQIRSVETDIRHMKADSHNIRQQIAMYKQRIENTPKREQELMDLTRDYDNLRQTYDSLLTRKIQAEEAAALERRQQGEQFRVIDPARVPEVPVKPQVSRIMLIAFALALGAGIGGAVGLELMQQRFYDPDDVEKTFELPVIAFVPLILSDEEKKKIMRREILLGVTACMGYLVVAGLLLLLIKFGAGSISIIAEGARKVIS